MNRSEVNKTLKELDTMCVAYKCYLPPFCRFTPEQWQNNADNTENRFNPPVGRFPTIDGEPPYRLLCNEYLEAK